MPTSTSTILHRVTALATTMAILSSTSLNAQEEQQAPKEPSKPTYEVVEGKITITAPEGTPPGELFQVIMKEVAPKNNFVIMNGSPAFQTATIATPSPVVEAKPRYVLGLDCFPIPDMLKSHLKLDHGLFVTSVSPEMPAAQAEIKTHDILLSASAESEGTPIDLKAISDLADLVTKAGEEDTELTIILLQNGDEKTLTIKPVKENRPSFQVFVQPFAQACSSKSRACRTTRKNSTYARRTCATSSRSTNR